MCYFNIIDLARSYLNFSLDIVRKMVLTLMKKTLYEFSKYSSSLERFLRVSLQVCG